MSAMLSIGKKIPCYSTENAQKTGSDFRTSLGTEFLCKLLARNLLCYFRALFSPMGPSIKDVRVKSLSSDSPPPPCPGMLPTCPMYVYRRSGLARSRPLHLDTDADVLYGWPLSGPTRVVQTTTLRPFPFDSERTPGRALGSALGGGSCTDYSCIIIVVSLGATNMR